MKCPGASWWVGLYWALYQPLSIVITFVLFFFSLHLFVYVISRVFLFWKTLTWKMMFLWCDDVEWAVELLLSSCGPWCWKYLWSSGWEAWAVRSHLLQRLASRDLRQQPQLAGRTSTACLPTALTLELLVWPQRSLGLLSRESKENNCS